MGKPAPSSKPKVDFYLTREQCFTQRALTLTTPWMHIIMHSQTDCLITLKWRPRLTVMLTVERFFAFKLRNR